MFQLQKFKYFADDVSKLDKADRFCYEVRMTLVVLGMFIISQNNSFSVDYKRNKKTRPSALLSYNKHVGIFKNTKEVQREARGAAECFSYFSSVLIFPKCFYNSTMLEGFYRVCMYTRVKSSAVSWWLFVGHPSVWTRLKT